MASRSAGGGTVLASGIRTRERKERKLYSDDWALGDDDIEGHYNFDLDDKLSNDKFNLNFVKELVDTEYNIQYIQKNGFSWPLVFKDKKNLDIIIPDKNFSLNDVRLAVGSRRMLDVMDVNTQKNVEMTMKDWQRYYESTDKDKLLNVISLEFSHTRLEHQVEPPTIVKQLDWVEQVWPRHLKEAQTESTNVLEDMMYPKVQKYCLMSVKGCYTDFHIDFGGTSVWYHILKGEKIFWLIPPSEKNLSLYSQWVLSGKQSDVFFGDTVEKCARVNLKAGFTFFIPTGWIHAVYTPEDSLVFGGNFLHSFGIEKQLKIAMVEDTTRVPQKFRYPFFTEMLWYLLERYVHVLLGRSHLVLPPEEQDKYEKSLIVKTENNNEADKVKHLSQYELHGLKAIVMYLHALPTSKKCVPDLIKDPIALVRDVRTVVEQHRYDSPELAATNESILKWWKREPAKFTYKRPSSDGPGFAKKRRHTVDHKIPVQLPPNAAKIRHRRVRCKQCEACIREDCQQCIFCLDMSKYGGPGTMKQTCKLKKCIQPCLPAAACCYICQLDGWLRMISIPGQKPPADCPNTLLECSVCYNISHEECIADRVKDVKGSKAEESANTWECPECIELGYNKEYKHVKPGSGRGSSAGSDFNIKSPSASSEIDEKIKEEQKENGIVIGEEQNDKNDEMLDLIAKCEPRMPTWDDLQERVNFPLVKPKWVVRPAPCVESADENENGNSPQEKKEKNLALNKIVVLSVFRYLTAKELLVAMQVCKKWAKYSIDPSVWKKLSITENKLNFNHLMGIVRRQPAELVLDWSSFNDEQFEWLLARLPQLQALSLRGLSWGDIYPLTSPYCPGITKLDLTFCEGITDKNLLSLLCPPNFHRPGHRDALSRLRNLTHLSLAGTRITEEGVHAIASRLPFLTHLDLSNCSYISEVAIAVMVLPTSVICHSLTDLDMRGCHSMSPLCLPSLKKLPLLTKLYLHPCNNVPFKAIEIWATSNGYKIDPDSSTLFKPIIKEKVSSEAVKFVLKKKKSSTESLRLQSKYKSDSERRTRKILSNKKIKNVEIKISDSGEEFNLESSNGNSSSLETKKTRSKSRKVVNEKSKKSNPENDDKMDIENASDSDSNKKDSVCRRSVRSSIGKKSESRLVRKRGKESKPNIKGSDKTFADDENISDEPSSSSTEYKSSKSSNRRKRINKNILTRSKKEKNTSNCDNEKELAVEKIKPEKVTKSHTLKESKSPAPKESKSPGPKESKAPKSKPNLRAVRKQTILFKTKLRNKSHELSSSSSGSSPELKGRRRSILTDDKSLISESDNQEKETSKSCRKKEEGECSKKSSDNVTTPLSKRRREKTDSSSQSSGQKVAKSDSNKTPKTDATRDRPERLHRSPRRLSLN